MNRADFSTDITKLSSEERRILAKDLWRMHHPDEPVDEEEFKRRFARSPILRAKRRGLLRNVCVALGNARDLRAVPALTQALEDAEPLVREHAAWALEQIHNRQGNQPPC